MSNIIWHKTYGELWSDNNITIPYLRITFWLHKLPADDRQRHTQRHKYKLPHKNGWLPHFQSGRLGYFKHGRYPKWTKDLGCNFSACSDCLRLGLLIFRRCFGKNRGGWRNYVGKKPAEEKDSDVEHRIDPFGAKSCNRNDRNYHQLQKILAKEGSTLLPEQ